MTRALLALDGATDVASVAATRADGSVAFAVIGGARRHAAEILPAIAAVLRDAGTSLDGVEGIVVGDGPGSFTGLRIAWAAAKGLAHEREIPLRTAPSLLGTAFGAWRAAGAGPETTVAACYDALRGQVFAAVYRFGPDRVVPVVAPALLTLAELARVTPARPRLVVGDGARLHADEVYVWTGAAPFDAPGGASLEPVAASLCALDGWRGGLESVADPATREPAYGRPAEAQVKWEARHGRPLSHPARPSR